MRIPFRFVLGSALAFATPLASAQSATGGNTFNPKISLILGGTYADYRRDTEARVPGFLLGEETGFAPEGLSLGETELALEANVDDRYHGWTTIALSPEGEVGIEEAYLNTLALPAGLAVKFGRFFSDIGYQNHQHAHAWEFADAPLVYRALLANQYGDDGVQGRWIAPTDLLVELGAEVLRGAGFPGGGENRSGVGAWTAYAHVGGDAGTGGSWRVGLWHLNSDADARATGSDIATSFTGDSRVSGMDLVFKWAPQGNPAQRNVVIQAEYMVRDENGDLEYDADGADAANPGPITSRYDGRQQGFYVQGVWQFMPRWRAGARYDQLRADNQLDNPAPGTALETVAGDGSTPQRFSLMGDFSNSEFSRLRVQINRDESRPGGEADNQVLVQYIFSLGSHPAHQF